MVLACSFCANTQLHQRWWQLGSVSAASMVLLVELVVASVGLKALPSPLRFVLNGLVVAALVLGVIGGLTAPVLGGFAFVMVLAVRALVVAAFTLRKDPFVVSVRLAVTAAALVACVFINVPANRSRDELVTLLTATPFRFERSSWAFTQLEAESAQGLAEVEQRLERMTAEDSKAVVTLELHQQLGGEAARRSALCSRLVAREHDERLAQRIERVCVVAK